MKALVRGNEIHDGERVLECIKFDIPQKENEAGAGEKKRRQRMNPFVTPGETKGRAKSEEHRCDPGDAVRVAKIRGMRQAGICLQKEAGEEARRFYQA